MKNFFKKGMTFALALTLVVTMCFGGTGTARAYAADTAPALSVYDGEQLVKEYSLDDLKAIAKAEGDIKYKYSGYNRNPSFYTFGDENAKKDVQECVGPTVAGILKDAGVTYTDDQLLIFEGSDGVRESFIAGDFFKERYYFPDGEIAVPYKGTPALEKNYANAKPVVPIVDLHRSDDWESVIRFGQIAPNEQNYAAFVKYVADGGRIIVGGVQTEAWDSVTKANYNSGDVLPGTELKFTLPDNMTGKKVAAYFTTDGTEPAHGDAIYNYDKYNNYQTIILPSTAGAVTYKFKVIGYGKLDSEVTTFTYNVVSAPAAPVIGDVADIDYESLQIQWGAVKDADRYEVYRYDESSSEYVLLGTVTGTSFTDKGRLPGEDSKYSVKAVNQVNDKQTISSDFSKGVSGYTELDVPVITGAEALNSFSVRVTWNGVPAADGYKVYRYDAENEKYQELADVKSGSSLSYIDSGLDAGQEYTYTVEAYRQLNDGGQIKSEKALKISAVTPLPDANLGVPVISKVSAKNYASTVITWKKVEGATGYEIYRYDTKNGETRIIEIAGGDTLSYTDTKLATGRTYEYKVAAVCEKEDGTKSYSELSAAKSVKTSLSKPVMKSASKTGYASVQIKWNKVSGASGYKIWRYDSKTKKYTLVKTIKSGSTVSWKNTGLKTGRKYTYKIKAYRNNADGTTAQSVYSGTKAATPALAKPVISKLVAGKKSITVKWKKVAGANGYKVYRATAKNGKYKLVKTIKKGGTLSWKNTKLKKGKRYYYKVKAYRVVDKKNVYSSISSVKYIKSK